MEHSRNGIETRAAMLAAGLALADDGLHLVTARWVAARVGCHHSNVIYYFKNSAGLLDAVAAEAIRLGNSRVIARLILDRHASVADMTGVDRDRHLLAVSGG